MATHAEGATAIHTQYPSLEGRKVLVSGGTTGNGRAIAALLAGYGANVFVFGRHARELRDALVEINRGTGKAFGLIADQARPHDVEQVFAAVDRDLGGLDILINNAAVDAGALTEGGESEWRYRIEADLVGYIDCTRRAIPRLKARGGGHIVNIGSIAAVHHNEGESLYVAAKAGIRGFSRALRKEVSEHNIKVSLIEPGMVGTDILAAIPEGDPKVQHEGQARGAMLKPEDIAVAVHYVLTQPPRCTISLLQRPPRSHVMPGKCAAQPA